MEKHCLTADFGSTTTDHEQRQLAEKGDPKYINYPQSHLA